MKQPANLDVLYAANKIVLLRKRGNCKKQLHDRDDDTDGHGGRSDDKQGDWDLIGYHLLWQKHVESQNKRGKNHEQDADEEENKGCSSDPHPPNESGYMIIQFVQPNSRHRYDAGLSFCGRDKNKSLDFLEPFALKISEPVYNRNKTVI